MQELIAALVSLFLVDPLQAELAERLAAARVPQAVVREVASCARAATPALVQRATSDPWWAVTSGINLWIGSARPERLLVEAAPSCAPAVEAARPFLAGQGA